MAKPVETNDSKPRPLLGRRLGDADEAERAGYQEP